MTDLYAEWRDYEAGNRRANISYAKTPSIVDEVLTSLETVGLGRTARAFNTTPAAVAAWFPDLIRHSGGNRFYLHSLPA